MHTAITTTTETVQGMEMRALPLTGMGMGSGSAIGTGLRRHNHAAGQDAVLAGLPANASVTGLPPVAARRGLANVTESVAEISSPQAAALTPAQESLLLEHLPLVRYVARGILERLPAHVELDELVGAGTLGLLDAVRKFNAGKNVQFRSYAQFRIRGAILDSLRSLDWSPRELRRKGRAVQEARRALEARLGRQGTDTELAADLGLPLAELQQLTGNLRGLEVATLNVERGEDSGEEELAFIPAKESENPLFQYLEGEARRRVIAAIDALPERERLVMMLYYFEEMTMREIGVVLGVVESRISQIHHETLRRLRTSLGCLRRGPGVGSQSRRVA